jgi:hypothetical protein
MTLERREHFLRHIVKVRAMLRDAERAVLENTPKECHATLESIAALSLCLSDEMSLLLEHEHNNT